MPLAADASSPPTPSRRGGCFIASPAGDFAGWETPEVGKELPRALTSLPSLPPVTRGPRRLPTEKGRNHRGHLLKPPACPLFLGGETPVTPALLPTLHRLAPPSPPKSPGAPGEGMRVTVTEGCRLYWTC